jgi:molybdopterin synthase sulfur carrier subunit
MSVDVYIPTPFRRATNNKDRVSVDARNVRGLLEELEGRYSGLKGLVRNEAGQIHDHVNVYVNNEGIESLQGMETSLKDGDEVSIIPALAGGGPALAGGGPALAGGAGQPSPGGGPALAWG